MVVTARRHIRRGRAAFKRHGVDTVGMRAIERGRGRGRMEGWDGDEVWIRRPCGWRIAPLSVTRAVVVAASAGALSQKSVGALGLEHPFRNVDGILKAASGGGSELRAHNSESMRSGGAKTAISRVRIRDEVGDGGFGGLRCRRVRRRGLLRRMRGRRGREVIGWRNVGGGGCGGGVHGADR